MSRTYDSRLCRACTWSYQGRHRRSPIPHHPRCSHFFRQAQQPAPPLQVGLRMPLYFSEYLQAFIFFAILPSYIPATIAATSVIEPSTPRFPVVFTMVSIVVAAFYTIVQKWGQHVDVLPNIDTEELSSIVVTHTANTPVWLPACDYLVLPPLTSS